MFSTLLEETDHPPADCFHFFAALKLQHNSFDIFDIPSFGSLASRNNRYSIKNPSMQLCCASGGSNLATSAGFVFSELNVIGQRDSRRYCYAWFRLGSHNYRSPSFTGKNTCVCHTRVINTPNRTIRTATPSAPAIWHQLWSAPRSSITCARSKTALGRPIGKPDFVPPFRYTRGQTEHALG
jgi:hypothetical protein